MRHVLCLSLLFSSLGCAVIVPAREVQVVEATPLYDTYYHSGVYWRFEAGVWYSARIYSGPFVVVETASVPLVVIERHDRGGHRGHSKRGRD